MKKLLLIGAVITAGFISSNAMAAGDAVAGKAKAASCAGCHGAAGISVMGMWPNLAGQKAAYTLKQLKDFKSGARKDPSMSSLAAPLSDEDMADLAAYYASLK